MIDTFRYTNNFSAWSQCLGVCIPMHSLPWWNTTRSTYTRAQTCSTWWDTLKCQDARAELQSQMHKLWEAHDGSHTSAPCPWSREHSGIHLQRQNSDKERARAVAEVDVWQRRVQDSMQLCQLLQQRWSVLQEPGWMDQMPARREMGRIKGVALLLCIVERLKDRAPCQAFVFKVTIKGRDALLKGTSSTHSFFNAQNLEVRYPREYSTYRIKSFSFLRVKRKMSPSLYSVTIQCLRLLEQHYIFI